VYYTRAVGKDRIPMVRSKKDFEKKQEFFLNESIQNYETVKAFGGEKVENKRYGKIINNIKEKGNEV
jgi:ABC-type transport system involved in Fe-S cluster assembly fused permease/ATPase subunit